MGSELLDWMFQHQNGYFRPSAEFFISNFGKSPNIEDLITRISAEIESLRHDGEKSTRHQLGNHQGKLSEAIRQWFRQIRLSPSRAYSEFANNVVHSGDTILTFNYDDSLERELKQTGKWDVSDGYGFSLNNFIQPSQVVILKLHGSINWLVSLFGGAIGFGQLASGQSPLGSHPVIHQADLEYLGYQSFNGMFTYPGGGAFPCLILPGRKKEFFYDTSLGTEYEHFWNALWSRATAAIEGARSIVLCGYSLLPVDERACELVLGKPKKSARIEIVSGSQTDRIAQDFRTAGFTNVVSHGGYFEDWVQRASSVSP
jgi:hypothetical protein